MLADNKATLDAAVEQLDGDFSALFVHIMSDALGVPLERVTILRIVAGSVIVEFVVDINDSEITELSVSGVDDVQTAIVAVEEIGGYRLVSVKAMAIEEHDATQDDPCAIGDWQSCTVAGQPLVAVAAIGLGATIVLLMVLRKLCCQKRAKVGTQDYSTTDYGQWN